MEIVEKTLPERPRFFPTVPCMGVLLLLLSAIFPDAAYSYSLEGPKWPDDSVVTFQMGLGPAGRTLTDGNTSWDVAAAPAATVWDNVMGKLQFRTSAPAHPPVVSGDGVNAIVFASSVFGQSFGSGTLAITYYRISGASTLVEADVLFNNKQPFDSYRGPLHYGSNGWAVGDIRRVLIHELGHALGLDHPDEHGQHVDAIMNSATSNRETPSADDIGGAQSLYGAPMAAPPTPSPSPSASPSSTSRFVNISTRMQVGTGDDVMIGGFTISGSQSKTVVLRALGPTLAGAGVANVLGDPLLELHDSKGALIASNDDWQNGTQAAQISAAGYAPQNANEAALLATLTPGAYTAIVRGYGNGSGVALVEIYQLGSSSSRLSNLSTRGRVGTGDDVLIGGMIVSGGSKRFVVRALGPSLTAYSVPGTLSNPMLELHNASGALLYSNDDWQNGAQAGNIRASGYQPHDPSESALLVTLPAGNYTAVVRGANNSSGVALVDAYDLDP